MIFLVSDTHFGHRKVAELRGFHSVADHDAELVRRWNAVVADTDTVYHLGDFALVPRAQLAERLALLNGRKHLILGNHDGTATRQREAGWLSVANQAIIEVDGVHLWLAHVPQSGDWHDPPRRYVRPVAECPWDVSVCGHVHDSWTVGPCGDVNVAVERWRLAPVAAAEVVALARDVPYSPA